MQIFLALTSELIAGLYLLALTLLVGVASFDVLVWRRTALPAGPVRIAAERDIADLILTAGRWSSIAVLALAVPRAFGIATLLDDRFPLVSRVEALIFRSEWGFGLAAILAAGLISLAGYTMAARRMRGAWPLIGVGTLLVGVASGLQGHPADAFSKLTLAPIFDGVHAIAIGGWLGAYFMILLAERRLPPHTASPWTDPLGGMLERYFGASGALATAVMITGLFSSATHLTGFDDLTHTQYGRVLAGKVGIFVLLMLFNEHHRRHAERKARTFQRAELVHTLRFQAGLIGLVLALSALLVDASPPGVNEVKSEVFHAAPKGSVENNDVEIEP